MISKFDNIIPYPIIYGIFFKGKAIERKQLLKKLV